MGREKELPPPLNPIALSELSDDEAPTLAVCLSGEGSDNGNSDDGRSNDRDGGYDTEYADTNAFTITGRGPLPDIRPVPLTASPRHAVGFHLPPEMPSFQPQPFSPSARGTAAAPPTSVKRKSVTFAEGFAATPATPSATAARKRSASIAQVGGDQSDRLFIGGHSYGPDLVIHGIDDDDHGTDVRAGGADAARDAGAVVTGDAPVAAAAAAGAPDPSEQSLFATQLRQQQMLAGACASSFFFNAGVYGANEEVQYLRQWCQRVPLPRIALENLHGKGRGRHGTRGVSWADRPMDFSIVFLLLAAIAVTVVLTVSAESARYDCLGECGTGCDQLGLPDPHPAYHPSRNASSTAATAAAFVATFGGVAANASALAKAVFGCYTPHASAISNECRAPGVADADLYAFNRTCAAERAAELAAAWNATAAAVHKVAVQAGIAAALANITGVPFPQRTVSRVEASLQEWSFGGHVGVVFRSRTPFEDERKAEAEQLEHGMAPADPTTPLRHATELRCLSQIEATAVLRLPGGGTRRVTRTADCASHSNMGFCAVQFYGGPVGRSEAGLWVLESVEHTACPNVEAHAFLFVGNTAFHATECALRYVLLVVCAGVCAAALIRLRAKDAAEQPHLGVKRLVTWVYPVLLLALNPLYAPMLYYHGDGGTAETFFFVFSDGFPRILVGVLATYMMSLMVHDTMNLKPCPSVVSVSIDNFLPYGVPAEEVALGVNLRKDGLHLGDTRHVGLAFDSIMQEYVAGGQLSSAVLIPPEFIIRVLERNTFLRGLLRADRFECCWRHFVNEMPTEDQMQITEDGDVCVLGISKNSFVSRWAGYLDMVGRELSPPSDWIKPQSRAFSTFQFDLADVLQDSVARNCNFTIRTKLRYGAVEKVRCVTVTKGQLHASLQRMIMLPLPLFSATDTFCPVGDTAVVAALVIAIISETPEVQVRLSGYLPLIKRPTLSAAYKSPYSLALIFIGLSMLSSSIAVTVMIAPDPYTLNDPTTVHSDKIVAFTNRHHSPSIEGVESSTHSIFLAFALVSMRHAVHHLRQVPYRHSRSMHLLLSLSIVVIVVWTGSTTLVFYIRPVRLVESFRPWRFGDFYVAPLCMVVLAITASVFPPPVFSLTSQHITKATLGQYLKETGGMRLRVFRSIAEKLHIDHWMYTCSGGEDVVCDMPPQITGGAAAAADCGRKQSMVMRVSFPSMDSTVSKDSAFDNARSGGGSAKRAGSASGSGSGSGSGFGSFYGGNNEPYGDDDDCGTTATVATGEEPSPFVRVDDPSDSTGGEENGEGDEDGADSPAAAARAASACEEADAAMRNRLPSCTLERDEDAAFCLETAAAAFHAASLVYEPVLRPSRRGGGSRPRSPGSVEASVDAEELDDEGSAASDAAEEDEVWVGAANPRWGPLDVHHPVTIFVDGRAWPSVVHYVDAVSTLPSSKEVAKRIAEAPTARCAQRIAEESGFGPRKLASSREYAALMRRANLAKFQQSGEARDVLRATEARRIRVVSADLYWGCDESGVGQNVMGELLMEIRRFVHEPHALARPLLRLREEFPALLRSRGVAPSAQRCEAMVEELARAVRRSPCAHHALMASGHRTLVNLADPHPFWGVGSAGDGKAMFCSVLMMTRELFHAEAASCAAFAGGGPSSCGLASSLGSGGDDEVASALGGVERNHAWMFKIYQIDAVIHSQEEDEDAAGSGNKEKPASAAAGPRDFQAGESKCVILSTHPWITPSYVLVAFRGTIMFQMGDTDYRNAFTDLNCARMPYEVGGQSVSIHSGFGELWAKLRGRMVTALRRRLSRDDVEDDTSVVFTGHSLGGALATLAAVTAAETFPERRKNITMYSFGSPRVGNKLFAEAYDALVPDSFRIVNKGDPVSLMPPPWAFYTHIGHAVLLNSSGEFVVDPSFAERRLLPYFIPPLGFRGMDSHGRGEAAGSDTGYLNGVTSIAMKYNLRTQAELSHRLRQGRRYSPEWARLWTMCSFGDPIDREKDFLMEAVQYCGEPPKVPTRVPLKVYWSSLRGDHIAAATAEHQEWAVSRGYTQTRTLGMVYTDLRGDGRSWGAEFVPLYLHHHPTRHDHLTTASAEGQRFARAQGYTAKSVEGYVFPSHYRPKKDHLTTTGLRLLWCPSALDHRVATTTDAGDGSSTGKKHGVRGADEYARRCAAAETVPYLPEDGVDCYATTVPSQSMAARFWELSGRVSFPLLTSVVAILAEAEPAAPMIGALVASFLVVAGFFMIKMTMITNYPRSIDFLRTLFYSILWVQYDRGQTSQERKILWALPLCGLAELASVFVALLLNDSLAKEIWTGDRTVPQGLIRQNAFQHFVQVYGWVWVVELGIIVVAISIPCYLQVITIGAIRWLVVGCIVLVEMLHLGQHAVVYLVLALGASAFLQTRVRKLSETVPWFLKEFCELFPEPPVLVTGSFTVREVRYAFITLSFFLARRRRRRRRRESYPNTHTHAQRRRRNPSRRPHFTHTRGSLRRPLRARACRALPVPPCPHQRDARPVDGRRRHVGRPGPLQPHVAGEAGGQAAR